MSQIKVEPNSELIILTEENTQEEKPKEKKGKLRRLVKAQPEENEKEVETSDVLDENLPVTRWKWKSLAFGLVTLLSSFFLSKLSISSCGFWATYQNNYNKIVYGDERWCYRRLETSEIVGKLREQVIAQNDAIKLIEGSLDLANREKIIQVAFVGPTGVGKSLTANLILENFKWQPAISLIFDINFQVQLTDQEAFDSDLQVVTSRLADCGFNLVVIDDVEVKSTTIRRIVELERSLHRMAKQNQFKIVLIVIFNGELKEVELNELHRFVIVEFQEFNEKSFAECIEVHEKLLKVKLKPMEVEDMKLINYTTSGCKTVAKKLNLVAKK